MTTRKYITPWLSLALCLSAGCAPPLFASSSPPDSPTQITSTADAPSLTPTPPPATPTVGAFVLDLAPQPTATPVAALALPSPPATLELQVWDGLPTYPADSLPDFYWRLLYDPQRWALTSDHVGERVLAARDVSGCTLGPAGGRGLPQSGSADHEVRQLGSTTFQISRVSVNGVTQFVNYAGGNSAIFTAFRVSFRDEANSCLQEAETVLQTLRPVPSEEATAVTPR